MRRSRAPNVPNRKVVFHAIRQIDHACLMCINSWQAQCVQNRPPVHTIHVRSASARLFTRCYKLLIFKEKGRENDGSGGYPLRAVARRCTSDRPMGSSMRCVKRISSGAHPTVPGHWKMRAWPCGSVSWSNRNRPVRLRSVGYRQSFRTLISDPATSLPSLRLMTVFRVAQSLHDHVYAAVLHVPARRGRASHDPFQ